ncbi:MAG: chemotaxis protein CheW [Cyanobacteria bacterium RU_5_0]|nr:chemotaxis protein CheW [Cyanobacteria bacterium RU_5_0]
MSDTLSVPDSQPGSALVSSVPRGEEFLRLYLSEMPVLLPIQHLTEVLSVPIGQIVPIPHTPPWVMGVYNWRGEILWMVDLGHLCGLIPWYQQSTYGSTHSVVVLQVQRHKARSAFRQSSSAKNQILGLVVNQVGDIERCNLDMIQAPPSSSIMPELASLVRGYWWQAEGDMLAILDGTAILEIMPK